MAIQLARRLTGLMVVATASRPESQEWCKRMGAHRVLDHTGDLANQARALGASFPYVFSTTNTERHWRALCDIVAPQGAICAIDDLGAIEIGRLKPKSASFHWEAMFARSGFGTPDMIAQHRLLDEVSALVDSGLIRGTMTRALGPITAANLREGHALVEGGTMIGKAVAEGW
jgi:NADPH2:quinone reductase